MCTLSRIRKSGFRLCKPRKIVENYEGLWLPLKADKNGEDHVGQFRVFCTGRGRAIMVV